MGHVLRAELFLGKGGGEGRWGGAGGEEEGGDGEVGRGGGEGGGREGGGMWREGGRGVGKTKRGEEWGGGRSREEWGGGRTHRTHSLQDTEVYEVYRTHIILLHDT